MKSERTGIEATSQPGISRRQTIERIDLYRPTLMIRYAPMVSPDTLIDEAVGALPCGSE
jgi:hypothetical protein